MKAILTLLFTFTCLYVSGQQAPIGPVLQGMANVPEPCSPLDDARKRVGKDFYTCDTVRGFRVVNDTLVVLYLGRPYPKHQVAVLLKGGGVSESRLEFWVVVVLRRCSCLVRGQAGDRDHGSGAIGEEDTDLIRNSLLSV